MSRILYQLCLLLLALGAANSDRARRLRDAKRSHEPLELTDADIDYFSSLSNNNHIDRVLDAILIPRVVGTPNHSKVGDYLVKHMTDLGWEVEQDIFTDKTPIFSKLNFRNIIARLNPDADRYLVLACHYDSKLMREHVFVGATDSAVPCAMMLNLAFVMQKSLNAMKSRTDLSLALIFFDGEEAFRTWGPTDSIYGARHLAAKWHSTAYPIGDRVTNHLDRIDILVLLDLLGAPDPVFSSYFSSTQRWYTQMAVTEQRLADRGLLTNYSRGRAEQKYFRLRSSGSYIEDDHLPFLRKNVNILHLIPSPFPDVWHTEEDNRSALDFSTIDNLNKIMRIFVAQYLHLHS